MKKVHANFTSIYANMNQLYNHDAADYRVKGGIVGIAARMCIDSILRNKLFEIGGFEHYSLDAQCDNPFRSGRHFG